MRQSALDEPARPAAEKGIGQVDGGWTERVCSLQTHPMYFVEVARGHVDGAKKGWVLLLVCSDE